MKRITFLVGCALLVAFLFKAETKKEENENPMRPYEEFLLRRSRPGVPFAWRSYRQAMQQARLDASRSSVPGAWQWIGPDNIGGRFTSIAVHPNPQIMLAASPNGGIFKTTNGGSTWYPVFDIHPSLAVAKVIYKPGDPSVVYAATGDPAIGGSPFLGEGVYRSTDGGETFSYVGLNQCGIITDLAIPASNPNVIYAAAMGNPFERDNNRGVYKSTDGGQTWTQVLFINNGTGVSHVEVDPQDENIVYCNGWSRIRTNQEAVIYGPGTGLYKSTNGGQTWNSISNSPPFPPMFSHTGIHMAPGNSQKLYAVLVDTLLNLGGIYKTLDGGQTWTTLDIGTLPIDVFGGFGWYFTELGISPVNTDELFLPAIDLYRFDPINSLWSLAAPEWWTYEVHADKHDIQFANGVVYLATDGGLYSSPDNGNTWTDIENIPATQFYRITPSIWNNQEVSGGAQDNGTTIGSGADPLGWSRAFGGDGFKSFWSPANDDLHYCEIQNGGLYLLDSANGAFDCTNGLDPSDRRNWDMPWMMSPHNSTTFYCGTDRVYTSVGIEIPGWAPISPDLTDGNIFGSRFHTISTVNESPVVPGILYVGTSDANAWHSLNSGISWVNITAGLSDRYITAVTPSPTYPATVYLTQSGYLDNDLNAYVYKSDNHGLSWRNIAGNLPAASVNDILCDPLDSSILYIASDAGVYYTQNGGLDWQRIGNNMPIMPVNEIDFNLNGNFLLAGTYARGVASFPLDSLITSRIKRKSEIRELTVYPNPLREELFTLSGHVQQNSLAIYDATGKRVAFEIIPSSSAQIRIRLNEEKGSGILFITGLDKTGRSFTKKILHLGRN